MIFPSISNFLNEGELPDRTYIWNVFNTLKPKSTNSIIKKALKNRSIENEDEKDNMIEIASEYLEKLMSIAVQKVFTPSYNQQTIF